MSNQRMYKLLTVLHGGTEAVTEAEIDFAEIVQNVKSEVDSYHHILKRLDHEEEWIDKEIKELQKKKATLRKNRNSFKKAIKNAMLFNEFSKIPGQKSKVSLRGKYVFESSRVADADLYERFPWAIKREVKYSWAKAKVKEVLKKGDVPEIGQYASVTKDYDAVFSVYLPKKGGA